MAITGSLVEHSMMNKLDDELNSAITYVGGDATGATSLADYPRIIRDQLTKDPTGVDGRIVAGDGAEVSKVNNQYVISADGTSNAKLVEDIVYDDKKIVKGNTVQDVLNEVFLNLSNDEANIISINEKLDKINESLENSNFDIQLTRTDIDCYDKYSINGVTYAQKLTEKLTYYLRIITTNPENPEYICLWHLTNTYGSVDTSDSHGELAYNINGIRYVQTELKPNEHYLVIYVGTDTVPAFINIESIINAGEIENNSVTIEKLDEATRNTINNTSNAVKEENCLTNEEAKSMAQNIFN